MPKAYVFTDYGGPETEQLVDQPVPEPGAGELLIAVRAAGVNAVDWKFRAGYLREFVPLELPAVFGQEASGVVEQVGQDVEGFAIGDEVFGSTAPGSGGYAEYTLLTADWTAKKPASVSFLDAATLPVAAGTAYDGVSQLNLTEGQTLLIIGIAGGVGTAAAQIARDQGLNVVGTSSADNRAYVESLGATQITYGDGVADRIRAILPDGVDGILDLIGGDALRDVADLLKDRSKLIATADPTVAMELGGRPVQRERSGRAYAPLADLVADGKLDPHVADDVRGLDEAGEALASVESGHARGKVALSMEGTSDGR